MKNSLFLKGVQLAAVFGSGAILLGCLNANTKVAAENQTKPPVPTASEIPPASPPPTTNAAVPAGPLPLPAGLENLSPGMAEILKLVQAHVGEDVIIAYVEKANFTFSPSADEILYLNDLGVSDKIMTAILHRSQASAAAPAIAETPAPETAPPVVATTAPPEPVKLEATTTTIPPDLNAKTPPALSVIVVPPPAPAAQPVVTVDCFYQELAPYGAWIEVDGYGRCWQPSVVVTTPHWQPYSDRGRWIYSDCGWYWQSDYSWGWAAFHYGRWHRSLRVGWVWVPDCTWGPSWVSWRRGDDYCGWAPLPPTARYHSGIGFSYRDSHVGIHFDFGLTSDCYTFVPTHRFCDPHPYRYRASSERRTAIFSRTTVNNHYTVNNNIIVNHGIAPKVVSDASGVEVKKVAISATTAASRGRQERLDKKSNTLSVYRPVMEPASAASVASPQVIVKRSPGVMAPASSKRGQERTPVATATTPPASPRLSTLLPRSAEADKTARGNHSSPATKTEPAPVVSIPKNEKPSAPASPALRQDRNAGVVEKRSFRTLTARTEESRSRTTAPTVVSPTPPVSAPRPVVSQPVTVNPPRTRQENPPVARVVNPAPAAPVSTPPSRPSEPRISTPVVRETPRSGNMERPSAPAPVVRSAPAPAARQEPPQRSSEGRSSRDNSSEKKR